ncbi:serine protease [Geodermatophilus sp. SYSU D00525]
MTPTARPLPRSAARTHHTAVRTSPARRTLTSVVVGTAAGLTLLVAAPATASAAPATPGTAPAEAGPGDAEKSLVYVGIDWTGYVEYPTDDGGWTWSDPVAVYSGCTGWFASDEGHIVTAGHCLDPAEIEGAVLREFLAQNDALHLEEEAQTWRVEGYEEGAPPDRTDVWVVQPSAVEGAVIEDPLTVQVIEHQPFEDGDLALLKANGLQEPTPPLPIATDAPQIGDPLTAIGYPDSVASVSDVHRLRASFKTGTVSSVQVSESGVSNTEINAEVSAGMSGGPTIDADGRVLGVNSFGILGEEQSFNFITDGAALRGFLERQGVEPQTGTGGPETVPAGEARPVDPTAAPVSASSGTPGWAYGAGGAVLLLALVAGGAFVTTRGRGRRTAPAPASAGPVPPAPVATPAAPAPPARSAGAERTRLIERTAPRPPVATACRHERNATGARFCGDCGSPLTR